MNTQGIIPRLCSSSNLYGGLKHLLTHSFRSQSTTLLFWFTLISLILAAVSSCYQKAKFQIDFFFSVETKTRATRIQGVNVGHSSSGPRRICLMCKSAPVYYHGIISKYMVMISQCCVHRHTFCKNSRFEKWYWRRPWWGCHDETITG